MRFSALFASFALMAAPAFSQVIINEVDADTAGSDTLEFVELYDGGAGNTSLDGLVVVFFNGSDDASYSAFDLDTFSTDANGYFVLGNAAVSGVDLVFSDNGLQNGADAVALYTGDDTDFPNDTPVTTTNLLDAIVYDTNDGDDAGLLVLLNGSEPQINEDGLGNKDGHSNQRCPNGQGGGRNTSTYTQAIPTPDGPNSCGSGGPPNVLINEIDADQGASDTEEFIEIIGPADAALDGLVVVLFDGSADTSYAAFDLDGFSTDSNGYFVLGNAAVSGVGLVFGDDVLQDGADAVAVYTGDGTDFPNGSAITTTDLMDAAVYGSDDSDDAELLVLLNAGQPQINENGFSSGSTHSSQRCPDGSGAARDTDGYVQNVPTPGAANDCDTEGGVITINEVQYDPSSGPEGDANGDGTRNGSEDEFVEIINTSGGSLDISGWEIHDEFSLRHVFPDGTVIADQCGIVVFGGATPRGTFGCMETQAASTGFLGLSNSGDVVRVFDDSGTLMGMMDYESGEGSDQSLTRDPDLTGPFVDHSTATGSGGALFSPGTLIDGSLFSGCDDDSQIVLSGNLASVTDGDTLSFNVACGLPSGAVGVFVTEANGFPVFQPVFIATFDASGVFFLAGTVPPGLGGVEATFKAFGVSAAGTADESNAVGVTFN